MFKVAVSGMCPEISPALAKLKVLVRTRSPKKLKHRCMSDSKVVTDSILQNKRRQMRVDTGVPPGNTFS